MDFESAYELSQQVDQIYGPGLIVAGFRRQRFDDLNSWALDVVHIRSGSMLTLDEKDDWQKRISELMPAGGVSRR